MSTAGPRLAIYDEVVARLLFDPYAAARHRLYGHDAPTIEIPISDLRHEPLRGGHDQCR